MKDHVEYWKILSRLHLEEQEWDEAIRALNKTRQLQLKIIATINPAITQSQPFTGSGIIESNAVARSVGKLGNGIISTELKEAINTATEFKKKF